MDDRQLRSSYRHPSARIVHVSDLDANRPRHRMRQPIGPLDREHAIARAALQAHSLTNWKNLDNFEDSALDWLAGENLDWERRRNLLQRLTRPDVPNLARLVSEDLR